MKTAYSIVALFFLSLLSPSCKKEAKYSTWSIGGNNFSTNKVEIGEDVQGSRMSSLDKTNGFHIGWGLTMLPWPGSHPIYTGIYDRTPYHLYVIIYFNEQKYSLSPNYEMKLTAIEIGEKAQYTLPTSWFINNNNVNDSLLVSGTFCEP